MWRENHRTSYHIYTLKNYVRITCFLSILHAKGGVSLFHHMIIDKYIFLRKKGWIPISLTIFVSIKLCKAKIIWLICFTVKKSECYANYAFDWFKTVLRPLLQMPFSKKNCFLFRFLYYWETTTTLTLICFGFRKKYMKKRALKD